MEVPLGSAACSWNQPSFQSFTHWSDTWNTCGKQEAGVERKQGMREDNHKLAPILNPALRYQIPPPNDPLPTLRPHSPHRTPPHTQTNKHPPTSK